MCGDLAQGLSILQEVEVLGARFQLAMEADKLMQEKAAEMALPRCGGAHLELKMDDK